MSGKHSKIRAHFDKQSSPAAAAVKYSSDDDVIEVSGFEEKKKKKKKKKKSSSLSTKLRKDPASLVPVSASEDTLAAGGKPEAFVECQAEVKAATRTFTPHTPAGPPPRRSSSSSP
jgi:hypothetical protein